MSCSFCLLFFMPLTTHSALFGAFPGRVTYVIGKDGICKSVYDDLANAEAHPEKALAALQAK